MIYFVNRQSPIISGAYSCIPRAAAFLAAIFCLLSFNPCLGQGLHFSQYFNAPLLASPANTGLMADKDYRASVIYRTQWGAVPVPFNSFSAAVDAQVFRRKNESNWLGVGAAFFSDKSGDGNLTLTRFEGFAAYHIIMGEHNMISLGASAASVTRSVDFSQLTFDAQWDGMAFDTKMSNREVGVAQKASYADISAGVSYAYFPNENLYIALGAGLAHVNRPQESFLNRGNQLELRPTLNAEVTTKLSSKFILNPSIYYTSQKGAYELLYGTLGFIRTGNDDFSGSVFLGVYQRWNDAVVGVTGYDWNGLRISFSYDVTTSDLGQYISHNGAMEISLSWQGRYSSASPTKRYMCPRF